MTKTEFLRELEEALTGEVSPQMVRDNVRYYKNYIEEEVRKGKREEEVIASLGSGRMIAKTILEANAQERKEYTSASNTSRTYEENTHTKETGNRYKMPWKQKIKIIAMIAVILFLVIFVVGLVFRVIWALFPLIVIGFLIMIIYSMITGNKK